MAVYPPKENGPGTFTVPGESVRVLVQLKGRNGVPGPKMFGRYNHVTDLWFVEGANGDFKVVKWWYIPLDAEGVSCA